MALGEPEVPGVPVRTVGRRDRTYARRLLPALVLLAVVTVAPTVYLIITSLTPLDLTRPATALDFTQPLGNYALLLHDDRFWNFVWVQAKLSAGTAIMWKVLYTPDISPVHTALLALGLPIPAVITHPDLALPAIIVADVWEWLPFTALMVLAALKMMPEEPLEAARIDGAAGWQIRRHIVLSGRSARESQRLPGCPAPGRMSRPCFSKPPGAVRCPPT